MLVTITGILFLLERFQKLPQTICFGVFSTENYLAGEEVTRDESVKKFVLRLVQEYSMKTT